jgi:hypothetical protein
MLKRSLLTMHDISLEVRVEVRRVSEDLKETAYTLLSLVLGLLLDINGQVSVIQVTQELVKKLKQLHGRLVVEFNKTKVAHKRGSIECVNNLLNLTSICISHLSKQKYFLLRLGAFEKTFCYC